MIFSQAQNLSLRNSHEGIGNLLRSSGAHICLCGDDEVLGLLPPQIPENRLRIPAMRELLVGNSPPEVLRDLKYETAPILVRPRVFSMLMESYDKCAPPS